MASYFGKDFDKIVTWAKEKYGPFKFVTKNRVNVDGDPCFGTARWNGKTWTICLERNMDYDTAILNLTHELGHVVAGVDAPDGNDWKMHGRAWALAYGRVYRDYLRWAGF